MPCKFAPNISMNILRLVKRRDLKLGEFLLYLDILMLMLMSWPSSLAHISFFYAYSYACVASEDQALIDQFD